MSDILLASVQPKACSRGMEEADRPAVVIAWVDCESCGRIEKATQDFNLPDDIATDMELWVWFPCDRCGRDAKLFIPGRTQPL